MSIITKRRKFTSLAAVMTVVALLVGTSVSANAAQTKAVSISFFYPDQVGSLSVLIDGYLKEFAKKYPNIHVKGVYSGDYDQTLVAVNTAIDAKKAPALAIMDQSFMHDLVDRKAVTAWNSFLTSAGDQKWLKAFYPQFMSNSVDAKGTVWGVPFARSTIVQYWNKDYFTKAGLNPDKGPATWDELITDAQAVQSKAGAKWGIFIPTSTGTAYWLYQALVQQAGGNGAISNIAGTKVTVNSAADIKALKFWASLGNKYGVAPKTDVAWGTSTDDFLAGNTGILWTTSGRIGKLQDKATFPWGVSALPAGVRKGAPTGGGSLMLFNAGVSKEQQQAAVTLAKFLTTPERAADVSIKSGYIATSPAAWNSSAMKAHLKKFPQVQAPHDAVANAVAEMSTYDRDRVVYQTLAPALQSVLLNGADAKQALTKAQKDIDAILNTRQ